jgi:hypothetical protein
MTKNRDKCEMLSLETRRRGKSCKKLKERCLNKFVASFVGTPS